MSNQSPIKLKLVHDPTFIHGKQYDRWCLVERKRFPKARVGGWSQVLRRVHGKTIPVFTLIYNAKVIRPHEDELSYEDG